jgi:hypothetical protein
VGKDGRAGHADCAVGAGVGRGAAMDDGKEPPGPLDADYAVAATATSACEHGAINRRAWLKKGHLTGHWPHQPAVNRRWHADRQIGAQRSACQFWLHRSRTAAESG